TTLSPGLTISNIQTAATQVTFTLAASASATLGTATFVFANPAIANGTASAQVEVLDTLPVVSASPSPIAIPPDSSPRQFIIPISRADTAAHSFNLSVADGTVASVSAATLTIPAGQTEVRATIIGLKVGQTSVIVTSPTLGKSVFLVFVTTDFAGIN